MSLKENILEMGGNMKDKRRKRTESEKTKAKRILK
jgi:hypothetical protein